MTRQARWALLAILLLATALRFANLNAQSFWNDEGNSARLSERSLTLIVEGTASDVHPPLYYIALRGWRELVGASEFGLRSLSAYAGLVTVALAWAIVARWTPRRYWWLPAGITLLCAINPALIYYSQETRMYALLALLALAATWALLVWLPNGKRRSALIGYSLLLAAGLYTHYFFPVVIAWHGVVVGVAWWGQRRWQLLVQWLAAVAVALMAYAPWLPIFWRQTGTREQETLATTEFLEAMATFLPFGPAGASDLRWLAWLPLLLLMLLALRLITQRRYWLPLALTVVGVLLPLLAMLVAGTTRPAFHKFILLTIVPLWAWAGLGVTQLRQADRWLARTAMMLLLLGAAIPTADAVDALNNDPSLIRADYRGMAARIAADAHPNAGIILDAPNQWEVFTYYHRDGAPVYPLPRGGMDQATVNGELDTIAAQHDRLYVLFWGEAEQDPERWVERWLDANAFKATDEWVGDVRYVLYAIPQAAATEMADALALPFGEQITLDGITLSGTTAAPGDVVGATLFWRTDSPIVVRYKIYLHLLDADGNIVAQRDSEPGGGLALTTTWEPNNVVRDNHGILIPADAPAGSYTIRMGLYDVADPSQRLIITLPDGTQSDGVTLATLTVARGEGR